MLHGPHTPHMLCWLSAVRARDGKQPMIETAARAEHVHGHGGGIIGTAEKGATAMTQPAATSNLSQRTPQEVFAHHAETLGAEDLEGILLDYDDTSTIITPEGVTRGKDAIRQLFAGLIRALPKARWTVKTTFADHVMLLEWTAESDQAHVTDGVDTFMFQGGLIQYQTVRFTLVPKR
jgi:hypothetical protein